MKKSLFCTIALLACMQVLAQSDGGTRQMAFYGVNYDTAHHSSDTIFRLDSSHIALSASIGLTSNTTLQSLASLPYYYDNNGNIAHASYISTVAGTSFLGGLGFEYLSKEYKNHMMFSIGIEAFYATCSGNIMSSTSTHLTTAKGADSLVNGIENLPYSISVLALSVPIKVYYKLLETKTHRLNIGLGVAIGSYISETATSVGYTGLAFSNPLNIATISLRYDVSIKAKTGISLEPYFSAQMFDSQTHFMFLGVKIASI